MNQTGIVSSNVAGGSVMAAGAPGSAMINSIATNASVAYASVDAIKEGWGHSAQAVTEITKQAFDLLEKTGNKRSADMKEMA